MSWLKTRTASLLDTIGRQPVDWYLVYGDMEDPKSWLSRVLKRGFQHVFALRRDGALWVAVHPTYSYVDVQIIRNDLTPWQLYPGRTVQHVNAMRSASRRASEFHMGPLSCVTVIKSLLGIHAGRVITPWRLHEYCRRTYV